MRSQGLKWHSQRRVRIVRSCSEDKIIDEEGEIRVPGLGFFNELSVQGSKFMTEDRRRKTGRKKVGEFRFQGLKFRV